MESLNGGGSAHNNNYAIDYLSRTNAALTSSAYPSLYRSSLDSLNNLTSSHVYSDHVTASNAHLQNSATFACHPSSASTATDGLPNDDVTSPIDAADVTRKQDADSDALDSSFEKKG